MDIDGVVIRGGGLIPGSVAAVQALRREGIPFAFMTNGGGVTEADKAQELAKLLDDPVREEQVMLAHTPMRELAKRYLQRRVVIVGSKKSIQAAESYGFDVRGRWAVTPAQIAAGTANIYPRPLKGLELGLAAVDVNAKGEPPIEAILIFHDPDDWCMEIQVLTDVLKGGRPLGSGCSGEGQAVAVYASNPDFLWQAAYPVPRYGQGAFLECLRTVWQGLSGQELNITEYGKPHTIQYSAVQGLLEAQRAPCSNPASPLQRIYMVGDNPLSDIRGANSVGGVWRSILVCTGVYPGGVSSNDHTDPAWRVEEDLGAAVDRLLDLRDEEHFDN